MRNKYLPEAIITKVYHPVARYSTEDPGHPTIEPKPGLVGDVIVAITLVCVAGSDRGRNEGAENHNSSRITGLQSG